MTKAALSSTRTEYAGDGALKAFAYSHPFLAKTDLTVIKLTESTGVTTAYTLDVDYSVSAPGNDYGSGGTITTLAALALTTDETLVVERNVPNSQLTDYTEASLLPAKTIENGLDKGALVDQQLQTDLDRTIKIPQGDPSGDMTLPSKVVRASKFMAFDSNGLPTVNTGSVGTFTGPNSVKIDTVAGVIDLDNDLASPGNNKVYGTGGGGVRGWSSRIEGANTSVIGATLLSAHPGDIPAAIADAQSNTRALYIDAIETVPDTQTFPNDIILYFGPGSYLRFEETNSYTINCPFVAGETQKIFGMLTEPTAFANKATVTIPNYEANICHWGGGPTRSPTENYNAFKNAWNQATTGNGMVVPAGFYTVNDTLGGLNPSMQPWGAVSIRGAGQRTSRFILGPDIDKPLFGTGAPSSGWHNAEIDGLMFDGNGNNQSTWTAGQYLVSITGYNARLTDVFCEESAGNGLIINGNEDVVNDLSMQFCECEQNGMKFTITNGGMAVDDGASGSGWLVSIPVPGHSFNQAGGENVWVDDPNNTAYNGLHLTQAGTTSSTVQIRRTVFVAETFGAGASMQLESVNLCVRDVSHVQLNDMSCEGSGGIGLLIDHENLASQETAHPCQVKLSGIYVESNRIYDIAIKGVRNVVLENIHTQSVGKILIANDSNGAPSIDNNINLEGSNRFHIIIEPNNYNNTVYATKGHLVDVYDLDGRNSITGPNVSPCSFDPDDYIKGTEYLTTTHPLAYLDNPEQNLTTGIVLDIDAVNHTVIGIPLASHNYSTGDRIYMRDETPGANKDYSGKYIVDGKAFFCGITLAQDLGGGIVGIYVPNHEFMENSTVVIAGTDKYDGIKTLTAGTRPNMIAFAQTFDPERFNGLETITISPVGADLNVIYCSHPFDTVTNSRSYVAADSTGVAGKFSTNFFYKNVDFNDSVGSQLLPVEYMYTGKNSIATSQNVYSPLVIRNWITQSTAGNVFARQDFVTATLAANTWYYIRILIKAPPSYQVRLTVSRTGFTFYHQWRGASANTFTGDVDNFLFPLSGDWEFLQVPFKSDTAVGYTLQFNVENGFNKVCQWAYVSVSDEPNAGLIHKRKAGGSGAGAVVARGQLPFERGRVLVNTTPITLLNNQTFAVVDTTAIGGVSTVNLPADPFDGQVVEVIEGRGNIAAGNITVGRNGKTIEGAAADGTISVDYASLRLRWSFTMGTWLDIT